MFKTTDGGSEWIDLNRTFSEGNAIVIDPTHPKTIYFGGSRVRDNYSSIMAVAKSTDGGKIWNNYLLSTSAGSIRALALHPNDPTIIFASGYDGGESRRGRIFKSINGGNYWSDVSSIVSASANSVNALAFDPIGPDTMYAGCDQGIYKSINSGASWSFLTGELSDICSIVIDARLPKIIYAASKNSGVHISSDGGRSWSDMNEGLLTTQINCLAWDSVNHLLFAGTKGHGVFRYDSSTVAPPIVPTKYALKPNYPNPFNSGTKIVYELPNASYVKLKVYNIAGQLIKNLVDKNQDIGQYMVSWDGCDETGAPVASGVYLCILRAGNYSSTHKMTLLR